MSHVLATEARRGAAIGRLCKWAFILFNVVMLVFVIGAGALLGEPAATTTPRATAVTVAAAFGGTVELVIVATIWWFGATVLGMLVLLTRAERAAETPERAAPQRRPQTFEEWFEAELPQPRTRPPRITLRRPARMLPPR